MSFLLDENLALSGDQLPSVITFRFTQISKEIFVQFFKDHYSTLKSSVEKAL
ncbi:MAG: hypothetical protein SFU99_18545 [Saprospiraceae bacterium]|nr:hypothetical protein [Saprospiraceae bacterium]